MLTKKKIQELLDFVNNITKRKEVIGNYNGVYFGGYKSALEDVLEVERPRATLSKTKVG